MFPAFDALGCAVENQVRAITRARPRLVKYLGCKSIKYDGGEGERDEVMKVQLYTKTGFEKVQKLMFWHPPTRLFPERGRPSRGIYY